MGIGQVISLMRGAIQQIIFMIAPVLGAALIVGLVVAIFQAVTSIQEQTLTFLPKLLIILLMLGLLGGFMFSNLSQYTVRLFNLIPNMAN